MSGRPGDDARPKERPQRTCVGCRLRADKSDLLRVVGVEGALVPDPRGRQPGRGAWVHPTPSCLDLAERRRAFPRALRHAGPLDPTALRSWIESTAAVPRQSTSTTSTTSTTAQPGAAPAAPTA